jgi:hypothetical protein
MYFARDRGADRLAYHDRVYRLAIKDRIDIEDIDALAQGVADLLDADALRASLRRGDYAEEVTRANDYAYEQTAYGRCPPTGRAAGSWTRWKG